MPRISHGGLAMPMQLESWPRTANGVLLHDQTSALPSARAQDVISKESAAELKASVLGDLEDLVVSVSNVEWKHGVEPAEEINYSAAAAAELGIMVTLLATESGIKGGLIARYPAYAHAIGHALTVQVTADEISGPIVIAMWLWMAWMSSRPIPGQAKIVSVTIAPASSAPNCKPRTVRIGIIALSNACR